MIIKHKERESIKLKQNQLKVIYQSFFFFEKQILFGMPNILDGSSALETPSAVSAADETSIDSTTSIQTNQTITPPSPPPLPPSTQNLGFCYSCNRRNLIDISNYSCSSCSSGFVEMLNETNTTIRPTSQLANSDPELESLFDNQLLRFINNQEPQNRMNNLFTESNDNETSATPPVSDSDSFFSRFRVGLRRNESYRNRFRNYTLAERDERDDESSRSSSSSSRRRSRSPPILGRTNRPFSRSRFLNYLDDDSNMFFDHGAIIITTLINQLRNRGAAPASETQIQNLPIVTIDQTTVDDSTQCAVCMDDFALNEEVKKLPCKHLFHDQCIAQWLKQHATCPVCRNNINGDESNNTTNSNNLLNDNGPTFFNIIPFPDEPTNSSSTSSSAQSNQQSSTNQRRNNLNLRNPNLYRIHIRQNLAGTNDSQRAENPDDPIVSRLRSGIRITTRLANDNQESQANNSENPRRVHHLNLNQMMQQFMSRHRSDGLSAQTERDSEPRSSIRVTTRLSNPEQTSSEDGSRYTNMMQHLMNQFRQVDRTINVNRQTENNNNNNISNSDDDVIEIEPETNRDQSNDRSNDDNLPNAKRRRV